MIRYQPKKIFIDITTKDHWLTKDILKHYKDIPFEIVNSIHQIEYTIKQNEDPITIGKQFLYITKNRGQFVKKCPGTNGFICCNYYVIDLIENCPLECSYCFLQSYLSERIIKIYVNIEDLFSELDDLLSDPKRIFRIGTGELSDSLSLDEACNFSKHLLEYFSDKQNAILELKTKTNNISNLLNTRPKSRVVISWSLNPQIIIEQEEYKTASLIERIHSAYQCQESGYQLAFHFDPIFYYDNWEKDYQQLILQLFEKINPQNIAWISLGGFRYNEPLQKIMEQRFEHSRAIYDEFFQSPDGKMRYFIQIREQIYKTMLSFFRDIDPQLFVYLCMEGKYMWNRVYGFTPKNDQNLDRLFIKRQEQIYPF